MSTEIKAIPATRAAQALRDRQAIKPLRPLHVVMTITLCLAEALVVFGPSP